MCTRYLCIVSVRPCKVWCDFLNEIKTYKIVVIVDDNNFDLTGCKNYYKNITFVQIKNETCQLHGYIDSSFLLNKLISGWDKALYYFGVENVDHEFIWFMEEDVFFYNEDTLVQIDQRYIDDDLLSNKYNESNGDKNTWHWSFIDIKYSPPYYCAMVCAVRFSKKMMECIHNYTLEHGTLGFIEALFPTVAKQNTLKYTVISELAEIHHSYFFTGKNVGKKNIYHPVKNVNKHIEFRKLLEKR